MSDDDTRMRENFVRSDILKESGESTPADMIREIIHPSLEGGDDGNNALNKDLKVSNIDDYDYETIIELTDILLQCQKIGAVDFAYHLLCVRDTMLSASSSRGGFERKLQVTEINIHKLPEKKPKGGFNIFSKKNKGSDED